MNEEKVSYLKIIQNELELKKTIIQELINKETSILQINSNF